MSWSIRLVAVLVLLALHTSATHAESPHGPAADAKAFPSHDFHLRAHAPAAQLAFHYGLLQPVLLRGFNAAVDLRIGRLVATYSHGHGLDAGRAPGVLSAREKKLGARLLEPYTTGFGLGFTLLDELYLLGDVKLHAFELDVAGERARYKTLTVGLELGYRFFLWKGLHVTPVLRYWPNVWSSAPADRIRLRMRDGSVLEHQVAAQGVGGTGLFANLLVGWAFNL